MYTNIQKTKVVSRVLLLFFPFDLTRYLHVYLSFCWCFNMSSLVWAPLRQCVYYFPYSYRRDLLRTRGAFCKSGLNPLCPSNEISGIDNGTPERMCDLLMILARDPVFKRGAFKLERIIIKFLKIFPKISLIFLYFLLKIFVNF